MNSHADHFNHIFNYKCVKKNCSDPIFFPITRLKRENKNSFAYGKIFPGLPKSNSIFGEKIKGESGNKSKNSYVLIGPETRPTDRVLLN